MPLNLTPNAIPKINHGDVNLKPLVQIVDIKLVGTAQGSYQFLISDAVSTQHAMLATQLNDRVKNGSVKKGSVVQLTDYICSDVQNCKIIVVLNLDTIIPDCDIIGNPKMFADMNAQNLLPNGDSVQSAWAGYNHSSGPSCGNNVQNVESSLSASNQGSSMHSFLPASTSQNSGINVHTFRSYLSAQNRGKNMQSFQPTVQPPYQPPPRYRNHGATMKNEAPACIIPIAALNPYQGRWAIKGRVTVKGDLCCYNNARGDGKVFSFDLLDSAGGEIRVTCFNAVVDRFHDVIEVGRVYLISKGSLKPANKIINHLKNEWEILLEATSTVDLCPDEDNSIPKQQLSFETISEIETVDNSSIIDVIGIVIFVNPSVPILSKNGMETQRRVLYLKNVSGESIELTLWGNCCNKEGQQLQEIVDSGIFPVLAVKGGKVGDFGGKSLRTISSSRLFINPDIPEAHRLKDWFYTGGHNSASVSISRDVYPGVSKNEIRKTVFQIKHEGLGRSDRPDWVTMSAIITFVKTSTFCYAACPLMIGDRQCNKKVTSSVNSRWQCDRCNQEFDECDYRYLLQFQVQDHTGVTWVTAFQESGEEILGLPAKELYRLYYELQDDAKFLEIIRSILFQPFLLRLKIKEEMFGDEQKLKIIAVKADKVKYSSESKYLLDLMTESPRY